MIYLDNAATSFPKAPGMAEAMSDFLAKDAANPGRAGHRMAVAAEEMIERARLQLARFVNAPSHERMVFTLNGTDALNDAAERGEAGFGGDAFGVVAKRDKEICCDGGSDTELGEEFGWGVLGDEVVSAGGE